MLCVRLLVMSGRSLGRLYIRPVPRLGIMGMTNIAAGFFAVVFLIVLVVLPDAMGFEDALLEDEDGLRIHLDFPMLHDDEEHAVDLLAGLRIDEVEHAVELLAGLRAVHLLVVLGLYVVGFFMTLRGCGPLPFLVICL